MRPSLAPSIAIALVALAPSIDAFAIDVCGETVPANRFIDGFPAYAQCAGSSGGAIYSNNGIDTSATNVGAGWVRTQGSGGYQCTELARRYLHFRWNVTSVPNGNAGVWCNGTLPAGLVEATVPVHGDLIVLAPGSCGADATTGHVAVVDVVNTDSSLMAVQQNVASRGRYNFTCAACFLHVVANDGTAPDGGAAPDAGGAVRDAGVGVDSSATRDAGVDAAAGRMGTDGSAGRTGAGGAAGSGGAVGTGGGMGPLGTGGAAVSTGGGGQGGPPGTGNVGGALGVGGLNGGSPGADTAQEVGGCACRLGTGPGGGSGMVLLTFLILLAVRRGRRRPAGADRSAHC